jgi:hypothetical protein
MTPAPKRWFRWSLRTLFVVTAIFCWALAISPAYYEDERDTMEIVPSGQAPSAFLLVRSDRAWDGPEAGQVTFYVRRGHFNGGYKWPALALAVLIIWNVFARFRAGSLSRPTHSDTSQPATQI